MTEVIKPIFIFSLPRSGSTLLQRVMGCHPDISTATEPYILLPLFYSLREAGVYTEYKHALAAKGINDFVKQLPNGRSDYLSAIEDFALTLYTKAAGPGGGKYFLDKTPLYIMVIKEIVETFKDAKFIFLWRNPLAVVSSLINTFAGGRWGVYVHKSAIYEGMTNLVSTYQALGDNAYAIQYEDLLLAPEVEMEKLFGFLELPHAEEAVRDFSNLKLKGRLGDPTGVKAYSSMSAEPLEKWKKALSPPTRKLWCRRYLDWIGRDSLAIMGYDLDELQCELNTIPRSFSHVGSDIFWMLYGLVYDLFEPPLMKAKLRKLTDFRSLTAHT